MLHSVGRPTALALVLGLSACGPDPLDDVSLEPAVVDETGIELLSGGGRLGGPIEVQLRYVGPDVYGKQMVVTNGGGIDGRGSWDEWTVAPADGVRDPSPYWEDQRKGGARDHVDVSPEHSETFPVRLDESVRFPAPGSYAVQLTSVRGVKRVRSKPIRIEVGAPIDTAARAAELIEAIGTARGDARRQAFVDLALLGDPSTIPVAVEHIGDPGTGDAWSLVLHTQPDRVATRTAVEAAMDAPATPVVAPLLETWAALCYNDTYDWPVPLPSALNADAHRYRLERQVRAQTMKQCREQAAGRMVEKLSAKQGAALATSVSTAIDVLLDAEAPPAWADQVLGLVARALPEADPATAQRWLTVPRYWERLRSLDLREPLGALARGEATAQRDFALVALNDFDVDAAAAIVKTRYTRNVPAVSDDVETLLSRVEPDAEALEGLLGRLDGTDARRMRIAARFSKAPHRQRWEALASSIPETATDAIQGALAAGLLNSGSPLYATVLDRIGPEHPTLLSEAARAANDHRGLVARAMRAITVNDGRLTVAVGDVLADHGKEPELRRLIALIPLLEGHAEMGAMIALCTARNWIVADDVIEPLLKTIDNPYAEGLPGTMDPGDKDIMVLVAFDALGRVGMRFNGRDYVGEEAIVAKLRQLRPSIGVRWTFDGVDPAAWRERVEALSTKAGLPLVKVDGPD